MSIQSDQDLATEVTEVITEITGKEIAGSKTELSSCGIDSMTKLDILSGLEQLKVAVAYERNGDRIEHFPAEFGLGQLAKWKPVYEELPGWQEDIMGVRKFSDLPEAARAYIALIEEQVGLSVTSASVGPERDQVVAR